MFGGMITGIVVSYDAVLALVLALDPTRDSGNGPVKNRVTSACLPSIDGAGRVFAEDGVFAEARDFAEARFFEEAWRGTGL